MSQRLRLLCDANPMAYGSSSALLSIVDGLDAETIALVRDVSAEILASDGAIGRAIEVDVKNPEAVARVLDRERFDAALVVSNLANLTLYRSRGLPVFFVDILYWYTERKDHPVWTFAERTYAQAFFGVPERVDQQPPGRRPTIVGPLIRLPPARSSTAQGTLVNLGGVRSRFLAPGRAPMFLQWVGRLLHDLDPVLPPGSVTVAAGKEAVELLPRYLPGRAVAVTLPQRAYLEALSRAALVLTAPGLNAVLEALYAGVPLVFLPPQNATQVLQLVRYEAAGLVAPGLNLPALVPGFAAPERVEDEEAFTGQVLEALRRVGASEAAQHASTMHLHQQLTRWPTRASAFARARTELGEPGGAKVAADITCWWRAQSS